MMKAHFFRLLIILPLMSACKKEENLPPASFPKIQRGQMLLVCSEGNFRWNNSETGLLNIQTGEANWKAFSQKNQRPLGDVLQSAAFWDGKLWLVVNNSGRLEGLNPDDFTLKESISGMNSPRFLQPVSGEKAYVSDLYANALWIVKRGGSRPAGSIAMPGWTEEMIFAGDKLWVLCRSKPLLLGINPLNDQIEDSLQLPGNGSSMAMGPEGKIWLGYEKNGASPPGVLLIQPEGQLTILQQSTDVNLPAPDRLVSSATGDTLYFLNAGLCRMAAGNTEIFRYSLPSGNWYGLGLDRLRQEIWISDVKDYQQESRILRLDAGGNQLQEYRGGIISSRFYFW